MRRTAVAMGAIAAVCYAASAAQAASLKMADISGPGTGQASVYMGRGDDRHASMGVTGTTAAFSSPLFLDFATGDAPISAHDDHSLEKLAHNTTEFRFLDVLARFTNDTRGDGHSGGTDDDHVSGDAGKTSVGSPAGDNEAASALSGSTTSSDGGQNPFRTGLRSPHVGFAHT